MDARKNEDSIIEYQLRPEVKFGENIHPEEINLLKGILIKIRGGKNMTQSKNKLIEILEYVIADHSVEEKKNYLKNECGVEMTKELERKVEAMGESMGRAILQGMLEDAWDKGVAQERRNTEKDGKIFKGNEKISKGTGTRNCMHSFLLEYQKKKY